MTTSLQSDPRFVGDPIDVVSGANTDIITDIALRGLLPFRWTRYYNSARSNVPCSLGWGHAHHFDRLLIRDLDGLRYQDPLGSAVGFDEPTYRDLPTRAAGMELTRTDGHSYVISQAYKPDQVFHFAPGSDIARLARLERGALGIELRYSSTGTLREIVDSEGRLIRVTSDQAGRILKLALIDPKTGKEGTVLLAYAYDRAGNLVRATDRHNTTLAFAYDAGNRMTRRTDRRGYSFHFKYDDRGRCIHSRGDDGLLEVFLDYHPDAGTTFVRRGDGGQWIYSYNGNKTITQITDPYGNATKFILDESGRPFREIDPNGNVTILHYGRDGGHDYRIDPNGHVLLPKEDDPDPRDPLSYQLPTAALEWDFGRLVDAKAIQPPQLNDPLLAPFPEPVVNTILGKTATYDATAMSPAAYAAAQDVLYTDDFGRSIEFASPRFSQKWKYDANGNLIEHRDPDGSVSRLSYKSWNALNESIDPLGNVTSFDITAQALLAKVTDPGGTVTEYGYDLRDKLIEVREVGRVVERYRRDPAGNIVEKTDATGRTLVRWEIGPGNLDKVRTLGSGEKHIYEHNASGRIIKVQTPAGTATFAYDENGKLLADQRDGRGVVHEFKLKQLVSTTYFEKYKVRYRIAGNGDLRVEDPTGANHRFQVGRTGLIVKHLANGSRELSQFDAEGRCRRKAVLHNAGDASLWMHGYAYSSAGDLVAIADTKSGTTKYRHDAAHRLVEEIPPSGASRRYEHDGAGNLARQPGLSNVVTAEGNRLKEANGETFKYDARGQLVQRESSSGTIRYEYNDIDMLVGCDLKGQVWTASYDGLSRRVQKTWQGKTTTYYWDDFRLAAEVRHNGSCRVYIYTDEKALAPFLFIEYENVSAAPESGIRYYVFTNQIGAPIRVEDDAGRTVWSARLDPYGRAHVDPASTIAVSLRFPGHYFDAETGLHYNRFRYFSPQLGRYLQSDPAGLAGGINAYAYPDQPLTLVDIDGLKKPKLAPNPRPPGPAAREGPSYSAGCGKPIVGADKMSDAELRAALEEKLRLLKEDMAKAKAAGHTDVRAPDGSIIQIHPDTGPCLSAAVDKTTGKVYYGRNQDGRPDPMHPTLDANADRAADLNRRRESAGKGMPPEGLAMKGGVPGDHSEVNAVNNGMLDREDARKKDPKLPPENGGLRRCESESGRKTDAVLQEL